MPTKYEQIMDEQTTPGTPDSPEEEEAAEDEEPTPEPEPEPEPAPPPPPEGKSAEQQVKALEQAVNRFEKALLKTFEIEGPLEPVPMEGAIGFLLPGALAPKTNVNYQRCTTCNGHGQVLTGSVRSGEETADCPDERCKGHGYWKKQAAPPAPAPTEQAQQNGPRDEWERPSWMGDPSINAPPTPIPTQPPTRQPWES